MQTNISIRHGHLNEETQGIIREKAGKLLRFFDRLTAIEITVDMEHDSKVVEFLAHSEHKHEFVARGEHLEVLAAVDHVIDVLEGQLRRHKEKLQSHRRRHSAGEAPELEHKESTE